MLLLYVMKTLESRHSFKPKLFSIPPVFFLFPLFCKPKPFSISPVLGRVIKLQTQFQNLFLFLLFWVKNYFYLLSSSYQSNTVTGLSKNLSTSFFLGKTSFLTPLKLIMSNRCVSKIYHGVKEWYHYYIFFSKPALFILGNDS